MNGISDFNWLYKKYYNDNPELRRIVFLHSLKVAEKALEICRQKNLSLDQKNVFCAAMLHDIGVVKCYAPDIHAFGDKPYIQHGIEGKKILEDNGLFQFSTVCITHTGSGITADEIVKNHLPLPAQDMLPSSLLEKIICYSDKFYSKGQDLTKEKTLDQIIQQMNKFGPDSLARFMELHKIFS